MYGRDEGTRGGAEHLARIHGTEEDKVNCPFYFKIGACRHGDKCSRQHHKPPFSQTVIVPQMWQNPYSHAALMGADPSQLDQTKIQDDFNDFYEEIFEEFTNFGTVEDIQVCENLGDHMVGNVYVKFSDEEEAEKALSNLYGRYYAGRALTCEYSPVTDFREARCRQFDEGMCSRGGYCNFMHIREPSRDLRKNLEKEYGFMGGKMKGTGSMQSLKGGSGGSHRGGGDRGGYDRGGRDYRDRDRDRDRDRRGRGRSRSRSRDRYRDRERDRDRDRDRDRERDRDRDRDRDRERNRDRDSHVIEEVRRRSKSPDAVPGLGRGV